MLAQNVSLDCPPFFSAADAAAALSDHIAFLGKSFQSQSFPVSLTQNILLFPFDRAVLFHKMLLIVVKEKLQGF